MRAAAGLVALFALAAALLAAAGPAQVAAQDPVVGPALPRVLLFGDVTFDNHHANAAKALEGRVEVVRSELGHLHTGAALERLEEVLLDERWDVIAFNFGLSDLMFRDPRTRTIRAMSPAAGGVPVTSVEAYATHLVRLVARFRESGAELLWTTTLPLHPLNRGGALESEAVERYNAAATARMEERGVPVLDTHRAILDELAEATDPRQVDRLHNDLRKRDLSGPLVARILELVTE